MWDHARGELPLALECVGLVGWGGLDELINPLDEKQPAPEGVVH